MSENAQPNCLQLAMEQNSKLIEQASRLMDKIDFLERKIASYDAEVGALFSGQAESLSQSLKGLRDAFRGE